MTAERDYRLLYAPDSVAKGQWWHHVCHVKDDKQNEYGIQATVFKFGTTSFAHLAVTDVTKKTFTYRERMQDQLGAVQIHQPTNALHRLSLDLPGYKVMLFLGCAEPPRTTKPQTSIHYWYPRLSVNGYINGVPVEGVGCFDRETFSKLLLPNEVGWDWMILWLDDGRSLMRYTMADEDMAVTRIIVDEVDLNKLAKIAPVIIGQNWPKNDRRKFGYTEALCSVEYDGVTGVGYHEMVGLEGVCDV